MSDDIFAEDEEKTTLDRRQKVQSVEVGMSLLITLSRLGASVSLSRLAQATKMPPSKAHRYLRALINSGLVTQDAASGLYRLGPEALSIGFAAMGYLDIVSLSARPLAELRDRINETCMLSVWSNRGPAVVRIEPAHGAVVINVRMGSILPLLVSAAGLVYSAFLKDRQLESMITLEREELMGKGKSDLVKQAEHSIANARKCGVASVESTLTPGVSAISAPIFDHQNQLAGVFTVMGSTGYIDISDDGWIAKELLAAATETSQLLGCPKPPLN